MELVDLVKSFPTSVWSQKSASIQLQTDLLKFEIENRGSSDEIWNFGWLVLCSIDTDFHDQILVGKLLTRSTNSTSFFFSRKQNFKEDLKFSNFFFANYLGNVANLAKRLTTVRFASRAGQRNINLIDLVKSFPTSIWLQKSALIQPRTSASSLDHRSQFWSHTERQIQPADHIPSVL